MPDSGDDNLAALAHQAQRLADISTLGDVGGDDARIRELSTSQLADQALRLVNRGGCVGGSEINSLVPLVLHGIHRDNVPRACGFRTLNGIAADSAYTQYDDGLARPNLSGVDDAAKTRWDTASDQHRPIEPATGVDLHHRRNGHHGVFGKCSQQTHLANTGVACVEPVRSVELWALDDCGAEVAQVRHPA